MKTEFTDIKDYEGLYSVSLSGKIFSIRRGIELKPAISPKGYLQVWLSKNGIQKNKLVHRIVAETFISNPQSKPQVNHKDCNKLNANVSNLEWVTNSENQKHAFANGINSVLKNKLHPNWMKNKAKRVCRASLEGEIICEYESIQAAAKANGISNTSISNLLKGKIKSIRGMIFKLTPK